MRLDVEEVCRHDHIAATGYGYQHAILKRQHPRQRVEDVRRLDAMVDINVKIVG